MTETGKGSARRGKGADRTTMQVIGADGTKSAIVNADDLQRVAGKVGKAFRVLRETDADIAVRDGVHRASRAELTGFAEEIERAEERRAQESDQIKAIYAQAKARGYDPAVLRKVVKAKAKGNRREDIEAQRDLFDFYWDILADQGAS